MDERLQENLENAFPNLYKSGIYFEVQDGWFTLLWNLSEKLEQLILQLREPKDEPQSYHADQVKEKFGGLRFYMSLTTDEMGRLIDEAEKQSFKICEICGEPGLIRGRSWLQTRCDKHVTNDN